MVEMAWCRAGCCAENEKGKQMKMWYILLAVVAMAAGCRREDIREVTLGVPGLHPTNEVAIVDALGRYEGVDRRTIRFDQAAKTVSLKYDSMKVAQTNLRMSIQEKGVEVTFPENKTGMAGYINSR